RDFHVTGVQTCALPISAENPEKDVNGIHEAMKAFFAPQATEATNEVAEQLRAAQAENKRLRDLNAALMESPEDLPEAETGEFKEIVRASCRKGMNSTKA